MKRLDPGAVYFCLKFSNGRIESRVLRFQRAGQAAEHIGLGNFFRSVLTKGFCFCKEIADYLSHGRIVVALYWHRDSLFLRDPDLRPRVNWREPQGTELGLIARLCNIHRVQLNYSAAAPIVACEDRQRIG